MIPDITYYTMSISDNPTALLPSRDALKIRVLKRVFKLDGHGVTQCLLVTLHQYLNIRMGMGRVTCLRIKNDYKSDGLARDQQEDKIAALLSNAMKTCKLFKSNSATSINCSFGKAILVVWSFVIVNWFVIKRLKLNLYVMNYYM